MSANLKIDYCTSCQAPLANDKCARCDAKNEEIVEERKKHFAKKPLTQDEYLSHMSERFGYDAHKQHADEEAKRIELGMTPQQYCLQKTGNNKYLQQIRDILKKQNSPYAAMGENK
jgi:hypothetical protein